MAMSRHSAVWPLCLGQQALYSDQNLYHKACTINASIINRFIICPMRYNRNLIIFSVQRLQSGAAVPWQTTKLPYVNGSKGQSPSYACTDGVTETSYLYLIYIQEDTPPNIPSFPTRRLRCIDLGVFSVFSIRSSLPPNSMVYIYMPPKWCVHFWQRVSIACYAERSLS